MSDVGERASRLLARARALNPLPEGALAVAVGLVVSGMSTYVFLGVAHRSVNEADYSALVVLWTAMFALGNGIMQPLEQEVARAVSDRRARGIGPAPGIPPAGALGVSFAGGVAGLAPAPPRPVVGKRVGGQADPPLAFV